MCALALRLVIAVPMANHVRTRSARPDLPATTRRKNVFSLLDLFVPPRTSANTIARQAIARIQNQPIALRSSKNVLWVINATQAAAVLVAIATAGIASH